MTEVIEALRCHVDPNWQCFGVFLRVDFKLMNAIGKDNKRFSDCMLDLVTKWVIMDKGTGDLPRTWQTVVKAVMSSGYGLVAEELAKKYGV